MSNIIAFTGEKGSGKDTAALTLIQNFNFTRIAFAQPLKDMLKYMLCYQGVDKETAEEMVNGKLKEVPTKLLGGKTPRLAMQTLGTEWGRDLISQSIWVDLCLQRASLLDKVVITDVRFDNEAKAVKDAGGTVVKIQRPYDRPYSSNDTHSSEAGVSAKYVDYTILNTKDIPELTTEVERMYQRNIA